MSIRKPTVVNKGKGALMLYFMESAKVGCTTMVCIYIGEAAVYFGRRSSLSSKCTRCSAQKGWAQVVMQHTVG